MEGRPTLSFSDEDKVRTLQAHEDTVVVILWIGRYDVKKMLID